MSAIPVQVEPLLLPSPKLSILELLRYHLPPVAPSLADLGSSPDPIKLFTNNPPNIYDASHISRVSVPSQRVFVALRDNLQQSERQGKQSVTCPHSVISAEMAYPLWIITYWGQLEPIRKIRDAWLLAEDYLASRSRAWKVKGYQEGVDLVNQIFDSLSITSWSEKLHGFTNTDTDLATISLFASTQWIKDDHANQMLDLLRKELRRTRKQSVEIQSTWFFEKIATGCDEQAR
jgi:hypothetical protein